MCPDNRDRRRRSEFFVLHPPRAQREAAAEASKGRQARSRYVSCKFPWQISESAARPRIKMSFIQEVGLETASRPTRAGQISRFLQSRFPRAAIWLLMPPRFSRSRLVMSRVIDLNCGWLCASSRSPRSALPPPPPIFSMRAIRRRGPRPKASPSLWRAISNCSRTR